MKRSLVIALLLAAQGFLLAAEKGRPIRDGSGEVVGIVKKERERVISYQGNDPITRSEPFYELSILFKDTVYTGEYDPPQFGADQVSNDWKINQSVEARVDKHHIYVRPAHGVELKLPILNKQPASTVQNVPNPVP